MSKLTNLKKIELEMSLLVICKILGLLVSTFTADDQYSLLSRDNLPQSIQMQLPQKQKNLFWIFFCIFEIYIKFWAFLKKDDPQSWCISVTTDSEIRR